MDRGDRHAAPAVREGAINPTQGHRGRADFNRRMEVTIMKKDNYTPGHSEVSRRFMAKRSLEAHGVFIQPYLKDGLRVLDCGCGPGTISAGLADMVGRGAVVGIDQSEQQIAEAKSLHKLPNLSFSAESVYQLPFEDEAFDLVFAHALFEHLGEPMAALQEIYRVLKPGGYVGLCSPDFAAFIITPETDTVRDAFAFYRSMQESNGGNTLAGRRLVTWLSESGFDPIETQGRCENYPETELIGEYLANQLDLREPRHAAAFRDWMVMPGACFAQMWISCVAKKGSA